MNKTIMVYYINTNGMTSQSFAQHRNDFYDYVKAECGEGFAHIIVPADYTKVECLNPRLVSKEELIKLEELVETYKDELGHFDVTSEKIPDPPKPPDSVTIREGQNPTKPKSYSKIR